MAKILIIDRSDTATEQLRKKLKDEGHDVKTARTSESALAQVKQRGATFHAVFLDASLGQRPEDQGPALMRHLKRLKATKQALIYGSVLREPGEDHSPNPNLGVWGEPRMYDFRHCAKIDSSRTPEPRWELTNDILRELVNA